MNPCSIAICCSSLFGHSQLCLIAVWLCRLAVFENYQKARASFVQTVADLSSRPQNVDALREAGVMALLRPLLIDTVPTIQQVPPPCARTSTPQKNKTKAQAAPPPSTALKARKLWRRVVPCLSPSHTHAHAHTHSHPHAHTLTCTLTHSHVPRPLPFLRRQPLPWADWQTTAMSSLLPWSTMTSCPSLCTALQSKTGQMSTLMHCLSLDTHAHAYAHIHIHIHAETQQHTHTHKHIHTQTHFAVTHHVPRQKCSLVITISSHACLGSTALPVLKILQEGGSLCAANRSKTQPRACCRESHSPSQWWPTCWFISLFILSAYTHTFQYQHMHLCRRLLTAGL